MQEVIEKGAYSDFYSPGAVAGIAVGIALFGVGTTVIVGCIMYRYMQKKLRDLPDDIPEAMHLRLLEHMGAGVEHPIAISLNDKPLELVTLLESNTTFDYGAGLGKTSWIKPSAALLVYDVDKSKSVNHFSEIVITSWADNAKTDFEALLIAFDFNKDKVFNNQDVHFNNFLLWQDVNMNGISEPSELKTLQEAGLVSIDFNTQAPTNEAMQFDGILNTAEAHWSGGSVTTAYDLAFFYEV